MSNLTITDVANKFGTDRATSYGLIHFMCKVGILTPNADMKRHGAKGKPADLYTFTHDHANKLAELIGSLQDYEPMVAVVEPTADMPVQPPQLVSVV